jgi:hypothetical protein
MGKENKQKPFSIIEKGFLFGVKFVFTLKSTKFT